MLLRETIKCPYCGGSGVQLGVACDPCSGTGTRLIEVTLDETFDRSWRIPTDDGSDFGVLVEIQHVRNPAGRHWYLICPATATLYDDGGGDLDLRDCQQGAGCDFLDDTHAKAHLLVQQLERARAAQTQETASA